jgi:CPA2 family monovalent cation:H+ antiporter-2
LASLALFAGMDLVPAIIVGVALAMSSTAVVVQVLSEEKRLGAVVGRSSFAVLLFQDIAVVPILFGVSMLALDVEGGVLGRFGLALGQAALAVVALIAGGRLLLRPLFRQVAKTRSPELFMAACLLVIMGTSLITAIAGLSAAMGALIAGLLLAETEYRRQIEVLIEPFKGLLVGVFLISVGMTLDLVQVAEQPAAVIFAAASLVALKALIVAPAARLFGLSWLTGIQAGLLLGAGGYGSRRHQPRHGRRPGPGSDRRVRVSPPPSPWPRSRFCRSSAKCWNSSCPPTPAIRSPTSPCPTMKPRA